MNLTEITNTLETHVPTILGYEHLRKSAILLPLIQKEDGVHLLFEVRSMDLRTQPGDICFPGGRMDPYDHTPLACAIRETTEELGINHTDILTSYPLDYIVSDFGRMIFPFAGIIKTSCQFAPNPAEVGEIFTIPIDKLKQLKPKRHKVHFQVIPDDDFPYDLIVGGENYDWQTRHITELFYQYDGRVIWGLTAKILHHFLTIIASK